MRTRTCTRCQHRRARKDKHWCGPCARKTSVMVKAQYGWGPEFRRHIRGSTHVCNLNALKPSPSGTHGVYCGVDDCERHLEFGVSDGKAWEWCPIHGLRYIPREMRAPRLHDQRETLEAELAHEVASQMDRVNEKFRKVGAKMAPITIAGRWHHD